MSSSQKQLWENIQKRTFCKWVNIQLRRSRMQIPDLDTGFKSGVALCLLCQCISGEKLPKKINRKPKMEIHMLENLGIAVKWLKGKLKLVGIGSRGIYEGDMTQILGLLWTIILRFQVAEVEIDGLSGKKGLLMWARKNAKDTDSKLKVNNFDRSWSDGKAFCAIVAKFRPDLLSYDEHCAMSPEDRLASCFDICENQLDIPAYLEPADLLNSRPDEKSVMTYVSEYFKKFSAMAKAEGMIKGIKQAVDVTMRHDGYIDDYCVQADDLDAWISAQAEKMAGREHGVNEDEVKEAMTQFYTYCAKDKTERQAQLYGLEGALGALHNSQSHNKRPKYAPEKNFEDMSAAFADLANNEDAYEKSLADTYKKFRRFRLIFIKFQAKADQLEEWLGEKEVTATSTQQAVDNASMEDPSTQIVALTNQADFLDTLSKEHARYQGPLDELAQLSGQIEQPFEEAGKTDARLSEIQDAMAASQAKCDEAKAANAEALKLARDMKAVLRGYKETADALLFNMNELTEYVKEPCIEESSAELKAHIEQTKEAAERGAAEFDGALAQLTDSFNTLNDNGFGDTLDGSQYAIDPLSEKVQAFKDLCDQVLAQFGEDYENEVVKEAAMQAFADAANALKAKMDSDAAGMSLDGHQDKPLEEQNKILQDMQAQFHQNSDALAELGDLHNTQADLGVVVNPLTPETFHSLKAKFDETGKAYDRMLENLMAQMSSGQKLSPEQLKQLSKLFNTFDEDNDGTLSPDEYHSATTAMGIVLLKEQVMNKFKSVDTDGDGKINFDEFCSLMAEDLLHSSSKSDVLMAFKALSGGDAKFVMQTTVNAKMEDPYTGFIVTAGEWNGDGRGDYTKIVDNIFSR